MSLQGVILLLADTLRRDHLDMYGYARETAPTLRRLAEEGTLFTHNVSQGTWTKVSVSSIMSGLYVFAEEQQLPERSSLAELLQRADVTTAAFVGNDVLVHDRGFRRGFDHFEGPVGNGNAALVVERFTQFVPHGRKPAYPTIGVSASSARATAMLARARLRGAGGPVRRTGASPGCGLRGVRRRRRRLGRALHLADVSITSSCCCRQVVQ